MKPAIKKKLVHALRSGEYKQIRGRLRRGDCFCVMGVLCNLHAQAHPKIAAQQNTPFSYMGMTHVAPLEVRQWAGVKKTPMVTIDGIKRNLIDHNDSYVSFAKLADAIEEQL